jgi:preprotein translocase subunit SecY
MLIFLIEIAILVAVIMGLIILVQGVRKIPVNYAKQIIGNRQFGGARQFLPVKVNSAGVMPIIFAQAIMFLPTLVSFTNIDSAQGIVKIFNDHSNAWYMLIYSIMVIGFTFLYTALIFNPKQISEDLKRNNGFIPGVKPGQPTADYIGSIMDKITLPGAICPGIGWYHAGICTEAGSNTRLQQFLWRYFTAHYGGGYHTSTNRYLLMRQYDGSREYFNRCNYWLIKINTDICKPVR